MAANPPSSAAFGSGRPTCLSANSVAGTVHRRSAWKPVGELAETEVLEAARGVDQDVAVLAQAPEDVHLVQQGGVLDDQRVGLEDRLPQADRVRVDPAERHHRGARALGAEARERLRVAALAEGGDGQQLGCGDDALATAPVNSDLEHVPPAFWPMRTLPFAGRNCIRADTDAGARPRSSLRSLPPVPRAPCTPFRAARDGAKCPAFPCPAEITDASTTPHGGGRRPVPRRLRKLPDAVGGPRRGCGRRPGRFRRRVASPR